MKLGIKQLRDKLHKLVNELYAKVKNTMAKRRKKNWDEKQDKHPDKKGMFLKLGLVVILVLLSIWLVPKLFFNNPEVPQININPPGKPSQTPTTVCPSGSWMFVAHKEDGSNPASQRWFYEGVESIKRGDPPKNGLTEWMEKSKHFRMTYAIMRRLAFDKDIANQETIDISDLLSTELDYSEIPADGQCATEKNIEEFERISVTLSSFEVFGPEDARAPENWEQTWFNSYYQGNGIIQPNIAGTTDPLDPNDKSVIFVKRHDGFIFAIRGVCGNIMTPQKIFIKEKTIITKKETVVRKEKEKKEKKEEKDKEKDPDEDVLKNDDVADWKKDGGENNHSTNLNNGATDSKGIQTDPKADAKKAEEKAKEESKSNEEAAEKAREEAIEVDSNQSHTESSPANW